MTKRTIKLTQTAAENSKLEIYGKETQHTGRKLNTHTHKIINHSPNRNQEQQHVQIEVGFSSVSMVAPQLSLVDSVDCHAHLWTCLEETIVGLVIAWSSRTWSNITTTWNCQHVPLFPTANLGEFVPKKSNITIDLLRSSPKKYTYSFNRFLSSCWMFHWEEKPNINEETKKHVRCKP